MKLNNKEDRIVEDIVLYEVKTKLANNHYKYDICINSFETYLKAMKLGVEVKLVSIILFEDWKYSFNIYDFDISKYNVFSRVLKNRKDAVKVSKRVLMDLEI